MVRQRLTVENFSAKNISCVFFSPCRDAISKITLAGDLEPETAQFQ